MVMKEDKKSKKNHNVWKKELVGPPMRLIDSDKDMSWMEEALGWKKKDDKRGK